ncbi:hypothetical protein AK812_SmicGene42210 [Symbiodinium microadriaticum]|uniref:E3 ubiquitin-protein ligase HERC2 n=1 Tax=Symbiodinium microadriaticum TaxID=2951 RepID=A0A1Q9C450_SYMMI|nr:hypothetical protein AK812_SmicGene42210 [Symbiodinium microadriaticum]
MLHTGGNTVPRFTLASISASNASDGGVFKHVTCNVTGRAFAKMATGDAGSDVASCEPTLEGATRERPDLAAVLSCSFPPRLAKKACFAGLTAQSDSSDANNLCGAPARWIGRYLGRTGHSLNAFAAILIDGSVVTWGSPFSGGDSSTVQAQLRNVSAIQSTAQAFAAIRTDGSVVTWGGSDYGPGFDVTNSSQVRERLKDVRDIRSSPGAFAALLRDGSVVTWGDSRTVQHQLTNGHAFAAIKADGTVVSWGHPDRGPCVIGKK